MTVMNGETEQARAERLARARRFLEAGRTGIDPAPPKDRAADTAAAPAAPGDRPDPTRFGDWEKNGRCIDF